MLLLWTAGTIEVLGVSAPGLGYEQICRVRAVEDDGVSLNLLLRDRTLVALDSSLALLVRHSESAWTYLLLEVELLVSPVACSADVVYVLHVLALESQVLHNSFEIL